MNILEKANQIVFERSEEKTRKYGPFEDGMCKAAEIFRSLTGKVDFTTKDMYLAMIALKMSRQFYSHNEDNLLDAVGYIGSLNEHLNNKQK